jgi:aminopeptidase
MASISFEQKLQRYAELTVKTALNLQPGQPLVIIAYQLETAPLVRKITREAYEAGSSLVTVLWRDDILAKIRQEAAPEGSFSEYPAWLLVGAAQQLAAGAAYLQIDGSDPKLLEGLDPSNLAATRKAFVKSYKPIGELQGVHAMQWSVIGAATPDWAARLFPDLPVAEAEARLWDAIFQSCRISDPDPAEFWAGYVAQLNQRRIDLTEKQYEALHFRSAGTDLILGMPEGHQWAGGSNVTQKGIPFMPNLPTEEVFSLPHKYKVNGTVRATKPLNYQGNLIEGLSLTFKDGLVVEYSAGKGAALLGHLLATDKGARYLGEVALVPHRSPISQSGLVYMHTLYDENAASHLALGSAYRTSLLNGEELSEEAFDAAGGNTSLVHQDFMFGSEDMAVDGLLADGIQEPVMRDGEWVDKAG